MQGQTLLSHQEMQIIRPWKEGEDQGSGYVLIDSTSPQSDSLFGQVS